MKNSQLFQSRAASSSEPSSAYNDLQGLKLGLRKEHVVQKDEARVCFSTNHYSVIGVYPKILNEALETVQFSGEFRGSRLSLSAQITRRKDSEALMVWLVNHTLSKDPSTVVDELSFRPSDDGIFEITTESVTKLDGEEDQLGKCVDGVKNRPGVFLKVANSEGGYYPNLMIFFPAQITIEEGLTTLATHFPVRKGETFVLHQNGTELTHQMWEDILRTFDARIDRAVYGPDEDLYNLQTHQTVRAQPDETPRRGFCGLSCSVS